MSKRVNSSNISMKTKSRKGSEVKRSKDSKDFKGSEGSKVSEGSTDVEQVLQGRYSSQRQLGLGLELLVRWLVRWLVGSSVFLHNRSNDFHETWQLFRDRYYEETDESFFGKKIWIIQ